jgi:hypothetical protein
MSKVTLVCEQCKCEFLTPLKRFNYLTKKGHKSFFCSRVCFLKNVSHKEIIRHCLYCKTEFVSTNKSIYKKCCSDLCAHKYAQTFLDVVKYNHIIKNNLQQRWAEHSYVKKICPICKKEFQQQNTKCCSNECAKKKMSEGARKSIEHQKETRSSKNEVMFADLCK